jgi:hypothetical protein
MVNPASPCGFRHLRNLSLDEFSGIRAFVIKCWKTRCASDQSATAVIGLSLAPFCVEIIGKIQAGDFCLHGVSGFAWGN